jgi:hypothetical protein
VSSVDILRKCGNFHGQPKDISVTSLKLLIYDLKKHSDIVFFNVEIDMSGDGFTSVARIKVPGQDITGVSKLLSGLSIHEANIELREDHVEASFPVTLHGL